MNCLKNIKVKTILVTIVFMIFFVTTVNADYTSISLSPSTGAIGADETAITVLVNSGTDEFIGIDTFLSFTGSVEYVRATGANRCSSFNVIEGSGNINIECFSLSHEEGESYNGTLATLYFRSTGTGTSTFTFNSTDPNATTKTGGTYNLSDGSSTTTTTTTTTLQQPQTTGDLPETSIFANSKAIFIVGSILVIFGIFFNNMYGFLDKILENRLFSSGLGKQKSMNEKL